MRQRISVDTETLGTSYGSVIAQIAACDIDNPSTFFNLYLDITKQADLGLVINADTVNWWSQQDARIKSVVLGGSAPLSESLTQFSIWLDTHFQEPEMWMNSPSFDSTLILAPAYKTCGQNLPWKYYQERDFRTLKAMGEKYFRYPFVKPANAHDALADARAQGAYIYELETRIKSIGTNIGCARRPLWLL